MMKITGLSRLFKWENLHNWWLTKYFFAPLYVYYAIQKCWLDIIYLCFWKKLSHAYLGWNYLIKIVKSAILWNIIPI